MIEVSMLPPPSSFQRKVAQSLGIDISCDSERVAAARIRNFVALAIGEKTTVGSATEKQINYGRVLGLNLTHDLKTIASARIDDRQHQLNLEALAKLNLQSGDPVIHSYTLRGEDGDYLIESVVIVSSIASSGLVYFKGGNGRCGWPVHLRRNDVEKLECDRISSLPKKSKSAHQATITESDTELSRK